MTRCYACEKNKGVVKFKIKNAEFGDPFRDNGKLCLQCYNLINPKHKEIVYPDDEYFESYNDIQKTKAKKNPMIFLFGKNYIN